jgi:death on curing protein
VEYLTLDDLLASAHAALGRPAELRDIGLLDAAVHRPQASAFGADAYPSLDEKAAALLQSIVNNHPLVDGNKRLGWVATRLLCAMNDVVLSAPDDDAFDLVMAVASGSIDAIDTIAAELSRWRTP